MSIAISYIRHVTQRRPYELTIRREVAKAMRKLPREVASRVRAALERLRQDPFRRDLDVKPLRGRSEYRLRVGAVRVLYERDDTIRVIAVLHIGSRGDIYKVGG